MYGGVVPEIAGRAHLDLLTPVIDAALAEAGRLNKAGPEAGNTAEGVQRAICPVDAVAATIGPGLIGSLLVGVAEAKALSLAWGVPFVGVNHLEGHLFAALLDHEDLEWPIVVELVSGGHTMVLEMSGPGRYRLLGETLDDAAGEAFDKGARMLGLGYPGGAALERLAAEGDPEAFSFPGSRGERSRGGRGAGRAAFARSLDFSFAGLKTALLYRLRELSETEARARRADLAASYQTAIVDSLIQRASRALDQTGIGRLAVGGGVAANGELRRRLGELDAELHVPPRVLCTDNAAMIASAARFTQALPYPDYLALDAYATGERPITSQPPTVARGSIL
jgi:N6-L-threonylcarbamoyladenine synthase